MSHWEAIENALAAKGFETRLTGRNLDRVEYRVGTRWVAAPKTLAAVAVL